MKKVLFKLCIVVVTMGLSSCHNDQKATNEGGWVKIDTIKSSTYQEILQFPAKIKASQEVNIAFKVVEHYNGYMSGKDNTLSKES